MESKQKSSPLATFVRERRKELGYTQKELSERVGVGYNFIRELEQGKTTLRMELVDRVLRYFGHRIGPVPLDRGDL